MHWYEVSKIHEHVFQQLSDGGSLYLDLNWTSVAIGIWWIVENSPSDYAVMEASLEYGMVV